MANERQTLVLEKRDAGVAIVWIDDPDEPVNILKRSLADEFNRLLDELEGMSELRTVVVTSGKSDSFIAGADLEMLQEVKTAADGQALSRLSHRLQDRLAALPVPKVAAIHGACLGGGLELALAFDARVVSSDTKTRLGLPEVQLGLLPGGGGTQRLPRLIGTRAALDLMLTGRQLSAQQARRLGLVAEVVPKPVLVDAAIKHGLALGKQGRSSEPSSLPAKLRRLFKIGGLQEVLLAGNPIGRKLLFTQARKQTLQKTRGNYPAPERILAVVRIGLEQGMEAGLEAEAKAFGDLVVSKEARELINIFFATTALKKDSGVDDPTVKAHPVNKVGVLGGGLMGAGISYVTALQAEIPVRLKDKNDAGVGHGLAYIRKHLDERVQRRRMTPLERDHVLARVTGTIDYSGFADADAVIEAVFEDLEIKRQMVRDIEAVGKHDVIFASNTSAIPISQIAAASVHPETVIGMHYFSPVEKMPLLEVVVTEQTAPWVTATCVALGKRQGKTVIVVRDGAGFYTSRILGPYINEAAYLLSEGVPVEAIDGALKDFGFPVGPIKLLDEVGIDVADKVGHTLHKAFGERMTPPPGMERLIADQRLGRKNKRGFYLYAGKKAGKQVDKSVYKVFGVKPTAKLTPGEITERCALQMVNEAALCFAEGILRSARDGDIGAVFGLGFPPFRGGPFRYVDALGAEYVVERLAHYVNQHGDRFRPAPVLVELAERGRHFYGEGALTPGVKASTDKQQRASQAM